MSTYSCRNDCGWTGTKREASFMATGSESYYCCPKCSARLNVIVPLGSVPEEKKSPIYLSVIPNQQTPIVPRIDDIQEFIVNNIEMINVFKEYAELRKDAIGLAANQCMDDIKSERIMLNMIAIKSDPYGEALIALNPKITKKYGMVRSKIEGCLTWGTARIKADRHHFVDIEYYNSKGQLSIHNAKGFEAQVWQHEINHIEGISEDIVVDHQQEQILRIGRNELCPCGSGKKYKKCCIED